MSTTTLPPQKSSAFSPLTPADLADRQRALPIPTFNLTRSICDVPTELMVQVYDDRVLVMITQVGKIGCMTQATLPASIPLTPPSPSSSLPSTSLPSIFSLLPPPSPSTHLTPLLGAPPSQTLHDLYINQIATLVWWILQTTPSSLNSGTAGKHRLPVVVGLALKISRKQRSIGNGDDDDGDDYEMMNDQERERFAGVMSLVGEWPGQ